MLPPKLLLFSLTLSKLIIHLDAKQCPKGEKIKKGQCVPCDDLYYQPEENDSTSCKPCTKCSQKYGSSVIENCTSDSNTKCQCRDGFVRDEPDSSICTCDIGFEPNGSMEHKKECVKCRDGFFKSKKNMDPCTKWTVCTSGVKTPGTTTSDVVCKDLNDNVVTTSRLPREESHTQSTRSTTTTTTTTTTTESPQHKGTTKADPSSSNTGNYIGMALLIFGIAGLLMLTAVTCRLHISPCLQNKLAEPGNDSCGRPVEESGDGSMTLLKVNAEP